MNHLRVLALAFAVFLAGCPKANVSTPADPPQVTVLKLTQLAATTNNVAAHTLKVLCQPTPPAVSALAASTCSDVAVHLRTAAGVFDKIAAEASSVDTWPVMRVKIAGAVASVVTSVLVSDPTLQVQLDNLQLIITKILGVR
jgi:hypothetical protein